MVRNVDKKRVWTTPRVWRYGDAVDMTLAQEVMVQEIEEHCPRHLVIMPGSGIRKVCGLGDTVNMGS